MTDSKSSPPASVHPQTWKFDYPIIHAETREQWRTWLTDNHTSGRGVWLCSWRTTTSRPRCPYPQAVEEAICFGWIDSTNTVFDEERNLQLFTPRRRKSSWTRLNRERAADMEARGLMTAAGRGAMLPRNPLVGGRFSIKSKTSRNHLTCRRRWTWTRKREATGTVFRPAPANRCCGGSSVPLETQHGQVESPISSTMRPSVNVPAADPRFDRVRYEGRSSSVRGVSLGRNKSTRPPAEAGRGGLGTRRSDLRQDADHTS